MESVFLLSHAHVISDDQLEENITLLRKGSRLYTLDLQ